VAGTWNQVSVPAASVVAGTKYWLAVLSPAGAGVLRFRDTPPSAGKTQTSASSALSALPATWVAGTTFANAPMSAYAVSLSTAPTLTPTPTSPSTLTATPTVTATATFTATATATATFTATATPAPVTTARVDTTVADFGL